MFCTYIVQFCCFRWFRFVILEAIYSLLCVIDFDHLGRPYGDILSVYYYVICLIVNSSIIGKHTYFVSHIFSWLVDNGEEFSNNCSEINFYYMPRVIGHANVITQKEHGVPYTYILDFAFMIRRIVFNEVLINVSHVIICN